MMLHIVNSQLNANALAQSSIEGSIVSCDELMYEGPLSCQLNPREQLNVRSAFFCNFGLENSVLIKQRFDRQHELLKTYKQYSEIVLWLNHSLNDQLLLLQYLHWFDIGDIGHTTISIISPDLLPVTRNVHDFHVLSEDQFNSLFRRRLEASVSQLDMASRCWQLICGDNPQNLALISKAELSCLPGMYDSMVRLMRQFPSKLNGLSSSERQILEVMTTGETDPEKIYRRSQNKEDLPFFNHIGFWMTVSRLINANRPAIELDEEIRIEKIKGALAREIKEKKLHITDYGREIIKYKQDFTHENGIDRWLAGTHLHDGNIWRWDPKQTTLNKTYV